MSERITHNFPVLTVLRKTVTRKARRAVSLWVLCFTASTQKCRISFAWEKWGGSVLLGCTKLVLIICCHVSQGHANDRQREKPHAGKNTSWNMSELMGAATNFPASRLWAASHHTSVGSALLSVTSSNRAAKGPVTSTSFTGAIFAL